MLDLLPELAPGLWVLLTVAALFVGFSKTAVPGLATISIAIFAAILPARASTAALLLLLILGDAFALIIYRRHADWGTLLRLLPAVLLGMVLGAFFLALGDDGWVRRGIGAILFLLMLATIWQRYRRPVGGGEHSKLRSRVERIGYGSLSGFTTMVANAGGAAMTMYLLSARFSVKAFLGTGAWLFAILNLTKVPISTGLGLITPSTLVLDLLLAPGVVIGALVGWWVASRLKQSVFEWAVIIATMAGAIYLMV